MIDYYAAYSPYSMLLISFTIACIVFGAYLSAYGIIKIGLNVNGKIKIPTYGKENSPPVY
jgi:hypothetical protein